MTSSQLLLLDIFSYSCMNCLRSLKFIERIGTKYKKYGLETILIHASEWKFEKDSSNILHFLKEHNIKIPLIIDKNKKLIKKLGIDFWPTQILLKDGKIIYKHIGEGNYKKLEKNIIKILNIKSKNIFAKEPKYTKFPALYCGKRKKGKISNLKDKLRFGLVYAEGNWHQNNEYLEHKGKKGHLTILTRAKKVYFVAKAIRKRPIKITIKIDGKFFRNVTINKPYLYLIARLNDTKPHKLSLITKSGLAAYSFAFE